MSRFPPNVGGPDWPQAMMESQNWRWFLAIIDWDWRDSRPLEALLKSDGLVPPDLKPVIEAIRTGTRPQKKQQSVNAANITGADRMRIAAEVSYRLGLMDVNRFNADRIAERRAEVTSKALASFKEQRREALTEARDLLALQSVNFEALEDLVRELRGYASRWPRI